MWYLDSNRYNTQSYGCDYDGPDHSKILKLDTKANNIQSFALIQTTRFKDVEQLFPYSYPHLQFTVKHGGDPIEAAVNITPRIASFQLSDSSRQLFVWGLNVLLISLLLFVVVALWFRKLGCSFRFEPQREAYIKELNKLKKQREENIKRLRGMKKPPKYESYKN